MYIEFIDKSIGGKALTIFCYFNFIYFWVQCVFFLWNVRFVPSETWILFKNAGPYISSDTFLKFPRMYVDFRDPVHFRSEISRALLCARSRARAHMFVRNSLRGWVCICVPGREQVPPYIYCMCLSHDGDIVTLPKRHALYISFGYLGFLARSWGFP